jgi:hypothetical protein
LRDRERNRQVRAGREEEDEYGCMMGNRKRRGYFIIKFIKNWW